MRNKTNIYYTPLAEPIPITEHQWDDDVAQFVSISCTTYNHEPYIRDAIEGFLMQKTTFPVRIVIFEDCSTDNTAAIIKEYAAKYPNLFRAFCQSENTYNKPIRHEVGRPFREERAKAKYIAKCEGDDYWTDPLKLQKQVSFLEANPEYSFCFHDAIILNQNTGERNKRIGNRKIDENVDLKSIIIQNNIPTASLLFRSISLPKEYPTWLSKTSKGDYALIIILSEKGLGKYIPEGMSAYRLHEGGVWSFMSMNYKLIESVKFYDLLYDYFKDPAIRKVIVQKRNSTIHSLSLAALRRGEFRKGLAGLIRHWNFTSDKRLKTPIRKILSAIKEGIKHRLKTKNNK